MGLDIAAGHFGFRAGSYSGFNTWREELAELAVGDSNLYNIWAHAGTRKKRIPFQEILCHSDCDGHITYRECKKLLDDFNRYIFVAMERINVPKDDEGFPVGVYWLDRFLKWKHAVELVVNREAEKIEFC